MKVATHLDRRSAPEGAGLRTVAGATGARLPCPLPMAGARHACSPAQRRFWVMDRIEPGTPALNLAIAWRVDAGLTGAMLGRAVAMLIERHPALRTSFAEEDGEPVQVVERSLTIQVPEIDLGGLAQEDALAEAARIARQQAQTPFDLSAAPLIRVTRIRLREPACVVLLTAHLLVCDRESLQVRAASWVRSAGR